MSETTTPVLAWTRDTITEAAYEQFGYKASAVLSDLCVLYERGLITYPMTDCGYLPNFMRKELRKLANAASAWARVERFDPRFKGAVWDDSRVGAHYGIVPTDRPGVHLALTNLTDAQMNLYRLVCVRFVKLFQTPTSTETRPE